MSSHHQARASFFSGSRRPPGVNPILVVSLAIVLPRRAARPAIPFAGADPADAAWTKTSASASESAR